MRIEPSRPHEALMRRPTRSPVALLIALLSAGCWGEPRAPFQAGGREVKAWVEDLKSPKTQVRRVAVMKLGNVGEADPAAAAALMGALRDPDPLVRHDAVLAVVKLKEPGAEIVAALEAMARGDKDARAQDAATKALAKINKGK
jgi:HEAT repeat protein